MNRPEPLPPDAQRYLADVDVRLRDLPPADHAELLADVEARLADLTDGQAPAAVLGPPAEFAADLRRAAGFAAATVLVAERSPTLPDWFRQQSRRPVPAGTIDYLRSLRPAWWALRGYLLFPLTLLAADHTEHWGLHTIGYYSEVQQARAVHSVSGWPVWLPPWLLLVVTFVVASVVLGRLSARLPPAARLGVVALDVLAVFVLLAWPTWWLAPSFAYVTGLAG